MINLISHAKINTYLKVIGTFGNLHKLDTDIIRIDLKNTINLSENNKNKDIVIVNNNQIFNTNTEKALIELRKFIKIPYFDVIIDSNIPVSAGLGSSSVDSAEIIKYFKEKYNLSEDIIKNVSTKIGSDVYALTKNYPVRIIGIGDKIEKIEKIDLESIVLVYNDVKSSTKEVFDKYDEISNALFTSTNDLQLAALLISDQFQKDCEDLHNILKGAKMTGSGSAMFYEETSEYKVPDNIIEKLKQRFKFVKRIKILK